MAALVAAALLAALVTACAIDARAVTRAEPVSAPAGAVPAPPPEGDDRLFVDEVIRVAPTLAGDEQRIVTAGHALCHEIGEGRDPQLTARELISGRNTRLTEAGANEVAAAAVRHLCPQ